MIVQTFKDFMYAAKQQYYAIKNQLYLKKIINDSKMHAAITECMVRKVITPDQFSAIFNVYDGKKLKVKRFSKDDVRVYEHQEIRINHDNLEELKEWKAAVVAKYKLDD